MKFKGQRIWHQQGGKHLPCILFVTSCRPLLRDHDARWVGQHILFPNDFLVSWSGRWRVANKARIYCWTTVQISKLNNNITQIHQFAKQLFTRRFLSCVGSQKFQLSSQKGVNSVCLTDDSLILNIHKERLVNERIVFFLKPFLVPQIRFLGPPILSVFNCIIE